MFSHKKHRIAFVIPYPLALAPGQRFRFAQYLSALNNNGHICRVLCFLSESGYEKLYKNGYVFIKLTSTISGFLMRFIHLAQLQNVDFVFLFREAAPLGPPIFEWMIAKILRKKIIYDFDDAIWLTDRKNESSLFRMLKWRSKVKSICSWSYKVSCGNRYLQEYALQFNPNTIINPTTIDCENIHEPFRDEANKKSEKVVIGWTGSHSTLKYLEAIEPVLQKLESEFDQVTFLVIADHPPSLNLQRWEFIPWRASSEIEDLLKMDIGIMPLPDDEWTKGKCGFKALQYLALEIPAVVSAVGVNTEIITQGVEGFLCTTAEEWLSSFRKLITDRDLRISLGKNGRRKVIEHYSVSSNSANFLSLFS